MASESDFLVKDMGYETPCHIWQGYTNKEGYGWSYLPIAGKTVKVHKWLYEKSKGKVPAGLHLDHLCRIRCCINSDHLEPVTPKENVLRGSIPKLSPAQILEIRRRSAMGESIRKLAPVFGVGKSEIQRIAAGERWAHIQSPEPIAALAGGI